MDTELLNNLFHIVLFIEYFIETFISMQTEIVERYSISNNNSVIIQ